jgi:hypothetical protein
LIRSLIPFLLLSSLCAEESIIEGIPAFVDEPFVESSIMIVDKTASQEETSFNREDKYESDIIDDVHEIPTVISLEDYQNEKSELQTKEPNTDTRIIKYINPQMYSVNLSQPDAKIDFWKLLNVAMEKSASIILKKHDMKITQSNLAVIKSEYYPNLSLRYFNEYYHGFSRGGSATIGGAVYPSNSEYRNALNLNVDYEVYRFGASDLKLEMGEVDVAILRSEIALEKERIAKELLQNYTEALKAQERIKTKKRILLVKNTLLENTQRLYEVGFASKTDITRLRIDAVHIEKEILRARLTMLDAIKNIRILTNIEIDTQKMQLAMLEPSEVLEKEFEVTALANNIKLQIKKKIKEMKLLQKEYFPTVTANGAYQIYGSDNNHFFDAIGALERNNWNIGITLKWDIFNGFQTDSRIQKAKLEIEKLIEQYRLERITFIAREEKRVLLREMIDKILSEEGVLLNETMREAELLTRLQQSGHISIMEVDKTEVSRLESELDFKLEVINQVNEDILSQLIM